MMISRLLRSAFLLALGACLLPAPGVSAADLLFSSETLVRVFERDTAEKEDALVVPAYEYLRLDAGALREKGLSFHLYGWGRADFGEGDFFEDDTAGELLYGYLQYAHPDTGLDLKLGRLYVFEGVADESVDGLRLQTDLTRFFTLSGYGGQPVGLDSTDGRSGDSILGGRLSHHLGAVYDVGVSFKQIDNDNDQQERKLGVDLSLALPFGAGLYGFSARNLETDEWGEHSYELRLRVAELELRPSYQKFRYEDFFRVGAKAASPFGFLRDTGETLEVVGGDAAWLLSPSWELGGKARYYDYDKRGDASDFHALLAIWHGQGLTSAGGELGYMQGDAAENDYLLARAYFYCDQLGRLLPKGFVTGDVVYVDYDQAIFGESDALFLSLGAGRSFLDDSLELKLSGDYSVDPFFDEDLRGMLVARYLIDR